MRLVGRECSSGATCLVSSVAPVAPVASAVRRLSDLRSPASGLRPLAFGPEILGGVGVGLHCLAGTKLLWLPVPVLRYGGTE